MILTAVFIGGIYGSILFSVCASLLFGELVALPAHFIVSLQAPLELLLVASLISPTIFHWICRSIGKFNYLSLDGIRRGFEISYGAVAAWVLFFWVNDPNKFDLGEPLFVAIGASFVMFEYFSPKE